ncbi:MAG: glycosyltransferase family protein [Eubacterium sp.]|nr:glycosyltransferase family protein [Eubacterium sp.]
MKYLVLIQARCGSTRLPNKVLKDLCGKTALEQMIRRVQKSNKVDEVMVITSIEKENLPILRLCSEIGIRVGVGSEEDVLDRYYQTAKLLNPEYVIRLTADCPCFDPELLDLAIEQMESNSDYCGMLTESFADGLDLEIMKFSALKKAWKEAKHSFEREHVTQYIIRHPELFKLQNFESPIGYFGNHRWTVDEPEDFEVVSKIFEHFIGLGFDEFNYKNIIEFLNDNPEIEKINSRFARNEGLQKSINNDIILNIEE